MFKLAAALAAITTVASALVCPQGSLAQDAIKPVKPGPTPHKIDIPASPATQTNQKPEKEADASSDVTIPAGTSVDEINAFGRKVTIGGTIRHNVFVNNGQLTLLKGAHVLGRIEVANGSTVVNQSDCTVTAVTAPAVDVPSGNPDDAEDSDRDSVASAKSEKRRDASTQDIKKPLRSKPDWFQAQFALAILGMLGAALASIVAPGASRKVAEHISSNPKKDLRLGVGLGLLLLLVVIGDALLLKMPLIKYFWAPFGIMIAYAPVLILGFGWLAGMRFAAEKLVTRFHWRKIDSLFKGICIGVAACGLLNLALGSISITFGVLSLLFEFSFALMGLGGLAAVTLKSASNG